MSGRGDGRHRRCAGQQRGAAAPCAHTPGAQRRVWRRTQQRACVVLVLAGVQPPLHQLRGQLQELVVHALRAAAPRRRRLALVAAQRGEGNGRGLLLGVGVWCVWAEAEGAALRLGGGTALGLPPTAASTTPPPTFTTPTTPHLQRAGAGGRHALIHEHVEAQQHKQRLVGVQHATVAAGLAAGRGDVGGRAAAAGHKRHQRAAVDEGGLVLVLLGEGRRLRSGWRAGGRQGGGGWAVPGCTAAAAADELAQGPTGQGRTSWLVTPGSSSSSVLSASVFVSWSLACVRGIDRSVGACVRGGEGRNVQGRHGRALQGRSHS